MSYQHFYSRVPARVSLYNKRDGFDTFAHSSGLDSDFILGELAKMYANKLAIHDPTRVRRGEIPVVYSQSPISGGRIAQTAITYNPVDFTGERSAYFAHTLIIHDGEKAAVINNPNADCFNPDVFHTDISKFNITSPYAIPNSAGPELDYMPRPLSDHRATVVKYDKNMVKSFIYSVLSAALGGRDVFFRLPCEDRLASREALTLINAAMSVLPYGVRERISFATFISGPEAYADFKVKCISSSVDSIPAEKGVFYDFKEGKISGRTADYEKNQALATFFYSLFEYGKIRETFLTFVARISEKYDSLVLDVATLREIVFLFWQCSGFYVENTVVADDEAICNLMDAYAKYREGLIEEHRVRAYRPLARYAESHKAIPDGVFSRLSRLYPTECVAAKAVGLDVLLKLVHVDLMRDTIFCFISRYYETEIDSVKAVINANLCRVFYGGFLQQPILTFFDAHFRAEPSATKDIILDKLLLSVRTPEIQRQILVFLDRHYSALNDEQKMKVISVCLEMMPECDSLSVMFAGLINRRICKDGAETSAFITARLTELLHLGLIHGDGRLLSIFIENNGFLEEISFRHILSTGVGAEILVALLAAMPAHKRGDKVMRAYKTTVGLPVNAYTSFLMRFVGLPVVIVPSGLKEMLRLDRLASLTLSREVISLFRETIIYPVIPYTFADVFKVEYGEGGLSDLLSYAENNPVIAGLPHYKLITDYLALVDKCERGDSEAAFKIIAGLNDSQEVRANVGEYIKSYSYDPDTENIESACTYQLVINYLCKGKLCFDRLYSRYQRYYEEIYEEEGIAGSAIAKGLNADRRGAASAMELILSCASEISDISGAFASIVVSEESGLRRAISDFIAIYGFGAAIFLKKQTKDSCAELEELCGELIGERNASITSVGDAVDILLRRNSK